MTLATAATIRSPHHTGEWFDRGRAWTTLWLVLGGLTLSRLAALALSPSELCFDEAQYWAWSRHFAFGYFTKPPLIAWVIGVETRLCGESAACIRSASPIVHMATALVLAGLARRLYGPGTGFWTGIFYAILPGIAVSSFLITTDVFLLFFWSVALAFLTDYLERPRLVTALGFALAVGLGLYAKYAMIYLPVLVLLATFLSRRIRHAILRLEAVPSFILVILIAVPNLWWNIENGFATFTHTGDNIGWGIDRLNPVGGLEFFGAQFGVAGPVILGAMLNALVLGLRSEKPATDRLLLWLSWPILIAMVLQGFLSQANANWGATAYPAGVVLATALILRHRWRTFFFTANLIVCGIVSAVVIVGVARFDPADASGPLKQLRQLAGWSETAENLERLASNRKARRLVVSGRALTAGMIYALRDSDLDVLAYREPDTPPADQFQIDRAWSPGNATTGTLLVGIDPAEAARLDASEVAIIDAPIYSREDGRMAVYAFESAEP